jgi:hypothetical protein
MMQEFVGDFLHTFVSVKLFVLVISHGHGCCFAFIIGGWHG